MVTPCHIIDLDRLNRNLKKILRLKENTDCKVLIALKGMELAYILNQVMPYLDGIHASSLFEARFGYERYHRYIQTYSPAYIPKQIDDIISYSDAIILNSESQLIKYANKIKQFNKDCGIRVDLGFSEVKVQDINIVKRFGIKFNDLDKLDFNIIDGIHIHCMCENYADTLDRLSTQIINKLGKYLKQIKWVNIGGGQLIGSNGFDVERASNAINRIKDKYNIEVILEPCEGILAECGYFVTKVLDVIDNKILILDTSPLCHMSDEVFRGWSHDIVGHEADSGDFEYELTGISCFSGDTMGKRRFFNQIKEGDTIILKDTATYNMVKQNMFNGVQLPNVYTYSKAKGLQLVKEYGYAEFVNLQT